VFDAVRSVSNQVALGERTIHSHAVLDHQANHDHLTQLATRAKFFRQLSTAVDEQPTGTVALLNIDLDDFKRVNDTYGHGAGDALLVEVAARMEGLGVPGALPARFGGDEFAMLLTGLIRPEDAELIAERLCDELVRPVRVADTDVTVGASIGVAVAESGYSAADLTRCADIAMYSAKAQGKNRVERFDPARHGDIARQRTLETHLGGPLAREEITLRFAPCMDPRTGDCLGAEALAQWDHPTFGTLGHTELMRLAAQTGDLPALLQHLLTSACEQFAALPGGPHQLDIAVPARQLLDPAFGPELVAIAASASLDPSRLTCEIIDADRADIGPGLAALAEHGIRIALDARTTADITISALSETAVHQLTVDATDEAALGLVLTMSEFLGIHTVVQGLTSPEELARLRDVAVTAVRGPAVGPAMDAAELTTWLARQRDLTAAES
jgi:diguanylate cyclase (GGDEF)-like protein